MNSTTLGVLNRASSQIWRRISAGRNMNLLKVGEKFDDDVRESQDEDFDSLQVCP